MPLHNAVWVRGGWGGGGLSGRCCSSLGEKTPVDRERSGRHHCSALNGIWSAASWWNVLKESSRVPVHFISELLHEPSRRRWRWPGNTLALQKVCSVSPVCSSREKPGQSKRSEWLGEGACYLCGIVVSSHTRTCSRCCLRRALRLSEAASLRDDLMVLLTWDWKPGSRWFNASVELCLLSDCWRSNKWQDSDGAAMVLLSASLKFFL